MKNAMHRLIIKFRLCLCIGGIQCYIFHICVFQTVSSWFFQEYIVNEMKCRYHLATDAGFQGEREVVCIFD